MSDSVVCDICKELRNYTNDENIKCSKCISSCNLPEDYSNEDRTLQIIKDAMGGGSIECRERKTEYKIFLATWTKHNNNIDSYIIEKLNGLNNSKDLSLLDFDIFISLGLFDRYSSSALTYTVCYTYRPMSRNMLKKEYNVTDETITKMSKLITRVKNRNVYALYVLPDNKLTFETFIGNTIAEYCKFKTIMNLMNKTN